MHLYLSFLSRDAYSPERDAYFYITNIASSSTTELTLCYLKRFPSNPAQTYTYHNLYIIWKTFYVTTVDIAGLKLKDFTNYCFGCLNRNVFTRQSMRIYPSNDSKPCMQLDKFYCTPQCLIYGVKNNWNRANEVFIQMRFQCTNII